MFGEILIGVPNDKLGLVKTKINEVHKLVLEASSKNSIKELTRLRTELQLNEGRIDTLVTLNLIDSTDYRLMKQEQSRLVERLQMVIRIKCPKEVV